jgi:hypothetical protein
MPKPLRVLLLTDSTESAEVLGEMVRLLGDDAVTLPVATHEDVLKAARNNEWDILIAHWHEGTPKKTLAENIVRGLAGRVRRIEIENDRKELTLAALSARQGDRPPRADWLVFMARCVLRKAREETAPRYQMACNRTRLRAA